MIKKTIVSTLTLLGIAGLSNIPAQAQTFNVGSSSSPSVTGAAVNINMNGAINAVAGQITFPEGVYADTGFEVDPVYVSDPTSNGWRMALIRFDNIGTNAPISVDTSLATGTTTSIESAIASEISTAGSLSDTVSLIRALGNTELDTDSSNPSVTGAAVTIAMNGAVNAMASEITFPEGVLITRLVVDPEYASTPDTNFWRIGSFLALSNLTINDTTLTTTATSVESAIASEISDAGNSLSDTVSLIRSLSDNSNSITIGLE